MFLVLFFSKMCRSTLQSEVPVLSAGDVTQGGSRDHFLLNMFGANHKIALLLKNSWMYLLHGFKNVSFFFFFVGLFLLLTKEK